MRQVPMADLDAVLVSVIVPVYNCADCLAETLESILAQTHRQLELICIDDGSTDGSGAILEDFAARDTRVQVLQQSNAGAGAARNLGLDAASGQWLAFLDADDLFEPRMLELALARAVANDADFCLFDSDEFSPGRARSAGPLTVSPKALPLSQASFNWRQIQGNVFRSMLGWAWDKLYRADFIRARQLRFPEQHNSEDLVFVFSALVLAERITVLRRKLVHQRLRPGVSLSKSRAAHPFDFYASLLALRQRLQTAGIYGQLEQDFINYSLHYAIWNLNSLPGQAFVQLYERLKSEIFAELGISAHPAEYFSVTRDYERYIFIMENDPISYLQKQKNDLAQQLDDFAARIPFGLGTRLLGLYRQRR
jgi:glycosyltransferase involved in cell wall biosynthesis